jgi:hypothetical protein
LKFFWRRFFSGEDSIAQYCLSFGIGASSLL